MRGLAPAQGFLIGSVLLSVSCTPGSPDAAWNEYRAQRYDKAIAAWQKVLDRNPFSGEAYYGLALAQLHKGAPASAERNLERATQLELKDGLLLDAYVELSKLYLVRHPDEHRYMEAVGSMADEILKRDPTNLQALLSWGEVSRWNAQQSFKRNENGAGVQWAGKSIAYFKQVVAKKTDDPKVWRNLALSEELAGELPAAAESWQRVIAIDANNAEGPRHLLRIYSQLGESGAAERVVTQVSERKPVNAELVLAVAEESLNLKRLDLFDRAAGSLRAGANLSATQYAAAARLHLRRGSQAEALSLFRLAERADPKHWDQHRLAVVRILLDTDRIAEANAEMHELRKRLPEHPKVGVVSAALLRREGRLAEAGEVLQRVLAQQPGDVEASVEQARIYSQQGDYPNAIAVLKSCQRTAPDYLPANLELAEVYLRSGMNEAAAIAASTALTKDPVNAQAQRLLTAARQQP